ncbi:MAG: hypothetical protein RIM72_04430 [Alphaproteobacteria bacterium]
MKRRLFLASCVGIALTASPVLAEILSRGKYGSRQAYYDRVLALVETLSRTDPSFSNLRDVAVTLSSALQDFAFNEASIRDDKALPPVGGLQTIQGNETEIPVTAPSSQPGPPRDLEDVPTLWFVDRINQARDRTDELVALIDSQSALPHDYNSAIDDIVMLVDTINRPPE